MFRYEEPESDQVPTDLVGEELLHAAFKAGRVARFWLGPFFGTMGVDGRFRLWRIGVQFFLPAKVFDHSLDTSRADLEAGLSDFMRLHLSRSIRVQESMPNDVTCHLLGAAVCTFLSPFFAHEGLGALQAKGPAKLVVPRRAEAECLSCLAREGVSRLSCAPSCISLGLDTRRGMVYGRAVISIS